MRIRRASIISQLGAQQGGGEAAQYKTFGANSLISSRWIEDDDGWAIATDVGVPLVEGANGFLGFEGEVTGAEVKTRLVANTVLIYGPV